MVQKKDLRQCKDRHKKIKELARGMTSIGGNGIHLGMKGKRHKRKIHLGTSTTRRE